MRVAKRALSVATKASSILRTDREIKETASSGDLYSGTGVPIQKFLLNNTEQGGDEGERSGEAITGSYLHLKARFYWASPSDSEQSVRLVRLLVFVERNNPSGTSVLPEASDILDFTGLTDHNANLAPYNRNRINDYTILHDEIVTITSSVRTSHAIDKKFRTKFVSKFVSFTGLDDYFYTNRLMFYIIPCAVIPTALGQGAMGYEYKSAFYYNR